MEDESLKLILEREIAERAKGMHERPALRRRLEKGNLCDELEGLVDEPIRDARSEATERLAENFAEIRREYMAELLEDEEEGDEKPEKNYVKRYRLSKSSPISPEVRQIVRNHYALLNVLLNYDEKRTYRTIENLKRSPEILTDDAQFQAVSTAAFRFRTMLMSEMGRVDKETDPKRLAKLMRWKDFDYRMLACLFFAASRHGDIWSEQWRRVLRHGDFWEALRQEPSYKNLLRAKWQQDKIDPSKREAYRGRDSRRRKSPARRRYMRDLMRERRATKKKIC